MPQSDPRPALFPWRVPCLVAWNVFALGFLALFVHGWGKGKAIIARRLPGVVVPWAILSALLGSSCIQSIVGDPEHSVFSSYMVNWVVLHLILPLWMVRFTFAGS